MVSHKPHNTSVKNLEKQLTKNNKELYKKNAYINNLKMCNDSLKDENFFLKKFINDLEDKFKNDQEYNNNSINNLKNEILDLKESKTIYQQVKQQNNAKYHKLELENKKIKEQNEELNKKNDEMTNLLRHYHKEPNNNSCLNCSIIQKKYNSVIEEKKDLVKEFNIYRRDWDQLLEETEPLIPPTYNYTMGDRINKVIANNSDILCSAKKIEIKKSVKDNIPILFKNKMSNKHTGSELPSLLSELSQLFLPRELSTPKPKTKPQKSQTEIINEDIARENSKLHNTVSELNTKLSRRENECDNLRHKLDVVKNKLTSLQETAGSLKKRELVSCMLNKPNHELEILNTEYKKLNTDFKLLQAEHKKLNQKFNMMVLNENQLKSQCNSLKDNGTMLTRQLKDDKVNLEKTVKDLLSSLDKKQSDVEKLTMELSKVENDFNTYKSTNNNSNKQLTANSMHMQQRLHSYQDMVSKCQKEIDELSQCRENMNYYKGKYNELLKKCEYEREKYTNQMSKFARKSWNSNAELDKVNLSKLVAIKNQDLLDYQQSYDELYAKMHNYSDLELDYVDLEKENSELRNEVVDLNDKLNLAVTNSSDQVAKLFQQNTDMKMLISKLESDKQLLEAENTKHETQMNSLIDDHDKLINEYEELLEETNTDKEQYEYQFKQYDTKLAEVKQLLASSEAECDAMDNELINQQRLLQKSNSELMATKEENKQLKETVTILDTKLQQAKGMKHHLDILKDRFNAKHSEYGALESDYNDIVAQLNVAKSEMDKILKDNEEFANENDGLDDECNKLQVVIDKYASENKSLKTSVSVYQEKLDELQKQNAELLKETSESNKQEVEHYSKLAEISQQDLVNLHKEYNELVAKSKKEEQEGKTTKATLDSYKDEVKRLQQLITKTKKETGSELQIANDSLNYYKQSLDKANKTVLSDKDIMNKNSKTIKEQTATINDIKSKYDKLIKENSKLSEQVKVMTPCYEAINKTVSEWDVVDEAEAESEDETTL